MSVRRRLPESEIRTRLTTQIDAGRALLARPLLEENVDALKRDYTSWDKRNELLLERAFEQEKWGPGPSADYFAALGLNYAISVDLASEVLADRLRADINTKLDRLNRVIENVDLYEGPEADLPIEEEPSDSPTVFVVHGRNDQNRLEVENLLHRVAPGITPIVLADQANRGQTLIEKLEEHLRATSFVIVLMTGDDEGRLHAPDETLRPRARQNVVLELGFAMGALGRRRVAILKQVGVELPSDINGLGYLELDPSGAWKNDLVADLKAAGIQADANRI